MVEKVLYSTALFRFTQVLILVCDLPVLAFSQ